MCLIAFAWRPDLPRAFVLAGNRDEYFARPAAPLHWWQAHPEVLAGRDLAAGGTWCGITRQGRFAALTNYRAPQEFRTDAPSRGALVSDYLVGRMTPRDYGKSLSPTKARFNGFNLITATGLGGTAAECWVDSNRMPAAPRALLPGVYGVSNADLDTPWPKVDRAKQQLTEVLARNLAWDALRDALFALLADATVAPDDALPSTGVALELERALSPAFIHLKDYGTRASSVIAVGRDGQCHFAERSFAADGTYVDRSFDYTIAC